MLARTGRILWLVAVLALVVAVAVSCGGGGSQGGGEPQGGGQEQQGQQGEQGGERSDPAPTPEEDRGGDEQAANAPDAPEDTSLRLTVPKMERVKNVEVPQAEGDDEEALKNYHAIHLEGTDYPWEEEANVYIAGHRLGYPQTNSYLAFYDLDKLKKGDRIIVTDSEGREYTYSVTKQFVVDPTDVYVTEPIEGKNIVSLQACTLPDYSRRLIVQGELVES